MNPWMHRRHIVSVQVSTVRGTQEAWNFNPQAVYSTIIVLTGTLRGQYTVAFMSHISLVANTGIELTLFCALAGCSLTRGLALGATTLLEVLVGAALTDSSAACQHGRANSIAYLGEASHHSCSEDNYDRN